MQRIIKKFCWKPYVIVDDYGNDQIKWFGVAYIMQHQTFLNDKEVWKDICFTTKDEYWGFY